MKIIKEINEDHNLLPVFIGPDGRLCPSLTISDKKSKRAAGLRSLMRELEELKLSIEFLIKNEDNALANYIRKASIITYGRLFASGQERGAGVDRNDIIKIKNKKILDIHDRIIELRNKHIAHADSLKFEQHITKLILSNPSDRKEVLKIYYGRITLIGNVKKSNIVFLKLVKNLYKITEYKWKKLDKEILECFRSKDTDVLYNLISGEDLVGYPMPL